MYTCTMFWWPNYSNCFIFIIAAPPKLASVCTPVRKNSLSSKSLTQSLSLNSHLEIKKEPLHRNSQPLDCLTQSLPLNSHLKTRRKPLRRNSQPLDCLNQSSPLNSHLEIKKEPLHQTSQPLGCSSQSLPMNSNFKVKNEPLNRNTQPLNYWSPQEKYKRLPPKNCIPSYVSPARNCPLLDPSPTKDNSPTGKLVFGNGQTKGNLLCSKVPLSHRMLVIDDCPPQNQNIVVLSKKTDWSKSLMITKQQ